MNGVLHRLAPPVIEENFAIWRGASGSTYKSCIEPIGGDFPSTPGVYIFCSLQKNELVPVYVGHTDNLARRLTCDLSWHPAWNQIVAAGAHFVCSIALLGDSACLEKVTLDLKDGLFPVLQKKA